MRSQRATLANDGYSKGSFFKMITPSSNISSPLTVAFEKHAFVSDDENIFFRFKERRPFKFT
jgi:hypothetical protein